MRADFSSQSYFRNPTAEIEKLRSAGPVVEVRFPIVGKVWTTTTQELADRVLKDSDTFTIRRDDGRIAGFQWWMPGILRTLRPCRARCPVRPKADTTGGFMIHTRA